MIAPPITGSLGHRLNCGRLEQNAVRVIFLLHRSVNYPTWNDDAAI